MGGCISSVLSIFLCRTRERLGGHQNSCQVGARANGAIRPTSSQLGTRTRRMHLSVGPGAHASTDLSLRRSFSGRAHVTAEHDHSPPTWSAQMRARPNFARTSSTSDPVLSIGSQPGLVLREDVHARRGDPIRTSNSKLRNPCVDCLLADLVHGL